MTRATHRYAVLFFLVILVSVPLAMAAHPAEVRDPDRAYSLDRLFFSLWTTVARAWSKEGSSLDPDGVPAASSQPPLPGAPGDEKPPVAPHCGN